MDAPKTIREQLMRRTSGAPLSAAVAGIAVAAMGMGGFLALGRHRSAHSPDIPVALFVAGGVLFVVLLMALSVYANRRRAKCPKCGSDLGPFAYLMQDTPRSKKINFCPYCAA